MKYLHRPPDVCTVLCMLLIDCSQSFSLSGRDVCSGAVLLCCLLIYGCVWQVLEADMLKADITLVTLSVYASHTISTQFSYTRLALLTCTVHLTVCVFSTCLDTSVFASVFYCLLAQIGSRSFSKCFVKPFLHKSL